jgi:hypothetical protein
MAGAKGPQAGFDVVRLDHLGATPQRDGACRADLALEGSDDEQPHDCQLRNGIVS